MGRGILLSSVEEGILFIRKQVVEFDLFWVCKCASLVARASFICFYRFHNANFHFRTYN